MNIYSFIYIYEYIYADIFIFISIFKYVFIYLFSDFYLYIHTCIHAYMHTCMFYAYIVYIINEPVDGDFKYTRQCSVKMACNTHYRVILFMNNNGCVNILSSMEHISCMGHTIPILSY